MSVKSRAMASLQLAPRGQIGVTAGDVPIKSAESAAPNADRGCSGTSEFGL